MVVMEVDIPKEKEYAFTITGETRMSYDSFFKKAQEIEEENNWIDVMFDEPVPMEEFHAYLKKQIDG